MTTPNSTPDFMPDSTPDSTPDSMPDSTPNPASAPDSSSNHPGKLPTDAVTSAPGPAATAAPTPTPPVPATPAHGATSTLDPSAAARRGVAGFPVLLGLVCLTVAVLAGLHELNGFLVPWDDVAFPAMLGMGGLLVLIGAVGLLRARGGRSRPTPGADAPSA